MTYQVFMAVVGGFIGAFWGCCAWRLVVGKPGASGAATPTLTPQDFTAQIRKLEVKDGDVVVVRLHVGASGRGMPSICRELKRAIAHMGINVMGVVLEGGASLDVLSAAGPGGSEVPDCPNRDGVAKVIVEPHGEIAS